MFRPSAFDVRRVLRSESEIFSSFRRRSPGLLKPLAKAEITEWFVEKNKRKKRKEKKRREEKEEDEFLVGNCHSIHVIQYIILFRVLKCIKLSLCFISLINLADST